MVFLTIFCKCSESKKKMTRETLANKFKKWFTGIWKWIYYFKRNFNPLLMLLIAQRSKKGGIRTPSVTWRSHPYPLCTLRLIDGQEVGYNCWQVRSQHGEIFLQQGLNPRHLVSLQTWDWNGWFYVPSKLLCCSWDNPALMD